MRFLENGPNIPDDLLLARDQGRVVYFCGAGVSMAMANLPGFFGLAETVLTSLGVSNDNAAAKILTEAQKIVERTSVPGLISADRIFGLLEREFSVGDIESKVANALRPNAKADLSAHRLLVDLATTEQGTVRIVTTNFDRMFDECKPGLTSWLPPKLPDPKRSSDMNGIVYLHGKANATYDGAEGDGFVLSSSEFGRAYLADGWATRFIRGILEKYAVVFVGYTADDPPVHYLLEALNRSGGKLNEVYAFQSGSHDEAASKWEHKGVEAIAYNPANRHKALWDTIGAWAVRARNPVGWADTVVEMARKGPEELTPWERGQVAHLVSTKDGARKFQGGDNPPPATWLCVFDKYRRYAKPTKPFIGLDEGIWVDPFPSFSIDSDIGPPPIDPIDPDDHGKKREVPKEAWDAFEPNKWDRLNLRHENLPALRGGMSLVAPNLPDRIEFLGVWISSVSNQNAAVWWAAHQFGIHPRIQKLIRWQLERTECAGQVLEAWQYLFEYWHSCNDFEDDQWFILEAEVKKSGWSSARLRKYEALDKPRLKIEHNSLGGVMPPELGAEVDLGALIKTDIEFREDHTNLVVPDDYLAEVVAAHHRNLVFSISLKKERGHYFWDNTPPIIPDGACGIDSYSRTHGLSGAVLRYAALFERLKNLNAEAAVREMKKWDSQDDHIFARLNIWATSFAEIVPDKMVGEVLGLLSADAFWNQRHQRDLLLVLKSRWASLPLTSTRALEKRLLEGRDRRENESEAEFVERRSRSVADRLYWLSKNGCKLNLNIDAELKKLKDAVPTWKEEYAIKAANTSESRGGWVRTEKEHSSLLQVPLANILAKAQELSGRVDDFLVENDPFAGLCESHPVKALAALRIAAATKDYPQWAWRKFLNSQARKNDSARFRAFLATVVAQIPNEALNSFTHQASDWLLDASKDIEAQCLVHYDIVTNHIIGALEHSPVAAKSAIIRQNRSVDWTMEALNAPAGKIAEAIFQDPRTNDLETGACFPAEWLACIERLLALPGDMRRHGLVMFTHNLNWFHTIDPVWTEQNLLSILRRNDPDDLEAWWAGYLWGAHRLPNPQLFLHLKPYFLNKAASEDEDDRDQNDKLAGLILASWVSEDTESGKGWITNEEFRKVLLEGGDQFRTRVLWQIENWSKAEDEGSGLRPDKLGEFLSEVWPLQKSAKTVNTSARLVELAFAVPEHFMDVSEKILPLLTKVERGRMLLPSVRREGSNIVDIHPERVLAVLHAVLPENVAAWPYEIDATLIRIGVAMPVLQQDERLIELNRKWNAR